MNAPLNPTEEARLRIAALTKVVNGSKLIALDQRTPEWHAWRKGLDLPDGVSRITGTAAGVCYGNNPFKTVHALWRELMGLSEPEPVNWAMQRGTDLEDIARALYIAFTGNDIQPMCVEHPTIQWAGASLDGIDESAEIINETKCVGKKTHSYAQKGILPDYYIPQCQWQLFVTPSAKEVHYWSLDADEIVQLLKDGATVETHLDVLLSHCKCVIVKPDPVMQQQLLGMAETFRQHLIDGTPPAGDAWLQAARHYVLAKQACEESDALLKAAEKQLLDVVPEEKRNVAGTKIDGGGVSLTYYEAEGSVDYAKLIADQGISEETVAKYRKGSSVRKRISLTGEMPIPAAGVELKLELPNEVASGNPARALDQW